MPTSARTVAPVLRTPDAEGEQVTQLLPGEPVMVLEELDDWSRVVAPWQPSTLDPAGYPGWVRAAHLAVGVAGGDFPPARARVGEDLVEAASAYLDTRYVWGGMTADGIDCSGLVHVVARGFGLRVPRDAADQSTTLMKIGLGQVAPGDVYFFARPGRRVHHVGFVSAPVGAGGTRRMLHAPDVGERRVVVEEAFDEGRRETLVGAARLPLGPE